MKSFLKATAFLLALTISFPAAAYDFMIDGIYYYRNSDGKSVTVTSNGTSVPSYSGKINIPSSIKYDDKSFLY